MLLTPPDQHIRDLAIDPSQSFAVSAPAGSGKTGLLTQRVLKLLTCVDNPEEILAITFTRKAAGEMQDRIINALWFAKENSEPENDHAKKTWQLAQQVLERDAEKNWELLQSPQRLRVTTIDSLCRNLTQQLPLASAIGAQPQTLENPDQAYRLAVQELFKKSSKRENLYPHLARLLKHLDNDTQKTESLLAGLLANRDQWLPAVLSIQNAEEAKSYFEKVLQQTIIDHLNVTLASFSIIESDFCRLADLAGTTLSEQGEFTNPFARFKGLVEAPSASIQKLDDWKIIADFLLTSDNNYRKTVNKNQGFIGGKDGKLVKEAMIDFLKDLPTLSPSLLDQLVWVRHLPSESYSNSQWDLLESLTIILPHLAAELLLVFKQLGATDFTQISQAALTALGDDDVPTDVALQLDYKIKHILIDEFQDTSSTQLALIERLTQGWQIDDGRTLFIVGDGMQSCYGFRNAKVGIFLDARSKGIGDVKLTPVDLTVNFRSHSGIVDWVNRVFKLAFPAQDEIARGAVKYSDSIAFKSANTTSAVESHIICYQKNEDDEFNPRDVAEQTEATHVAQLVQQYLCEHPNKTIAILVKSRSHLKHIVPALNQRNINFQANNIDSLAQRMSIIDLRSLAKAMLDPTDRIAWLAILRAPWAGLSLDDLHIIANTENKRSTSLPRPLILEQLSNNDALQKLSSHGKNRVLEIKTLIESTLDNRGRKPLSVWIEGLWIALGGPACLEQPNELEDTKQFFSLLEQFSNAGNITDWPGFDAALNNLYAAPQADADKRVQIMTIHKSKGLEFDAVIIPHLHKTTMSDGNDLLLMHERISSAGEPQLLLSSFAPVGEDKDPIYSFIREENKKQNDYEATRLLYVGCTRAIGKLYLMGCLEIKEDSLKAPSNQSLLAKIWPQIKDEIQIIESDKQRTRLSEQYTAQKLQRLNSVSARQPFPENHLLSSYIQAPSIIDITNPLNRPIAQTAHNRLARDVGNLIHATTEEWVRFNFKEHYSPLEFIEGKKNHWMKTLKSKGWSDRIVGQALDQMHQALQKMFTSELGQWILDSSHQESAVELRLVSLDMQGIREFSIDRTFVDKGIRWIIDYKTSTPMENEDLKIFISNEVATYKAQLAGYEKLLRKSNLTDHPIKKALYFIFLGEFIEVEP